MNVTKKNFRQILPEIEDAIQRANFFTLDCEFTGLGTENNLTPYDSPEEAFKKISENSLGFILIQFGLTAVRISDDNPDNFVYRTYNFYVFPRFWKSSFRCQGSSLSFLAENGFDFSKLFCEGISYCNQQEEKLLRGRFLEKQKQREEMKNSPPNIDKSNHVPVPDDEKSAIERICNVIKEFLVSNDTERIIDNCTPFQRRLVYEMIEEQFKNEISASTKTLTNNAKVIVIERKKTTEEEERLEDERKHNELLELEDCVGMSTVFQKISSSKKLIVGHNMLLDIIFILRQFFRPLPEDFREFKKFAHSVFPYIIDTKYMCTLNKFKWHIKSNVLLNLVQSLSQEPFSLPTLECEENGYGYSLNDNKAHEAGYDSYLTALAFLAMTKYLQIPPSKTVANNNELKQFVNKINVVRIQDVCYINLVGNEPTVSREHVFHVIVPETWKQSDLVNHFKNYGPIYITWINASSALVSLHNKENSSVVLKTISSSAGFKVQSYADFKISINNRLIIKDGSKQTKKRKHSESSIEEGVSLEKKVKKDKLQTGSSKSTSKIIFDECDEWV